MPVRSVESSHTPVQGPRSRALGAAIATALIALMTLAGLTVPGSAQATTEWHIIASEPEADTDWEGTGDLPSQLTGQLPMLPRERPPDIDEIKLLEHEDRLSLSVRPAASDGGTTPRENLTIATFTLDFILQHHAAEGEDDADVEGVYRLTVTLDGLAELVGTGTGTKDATYGLRSDDAPWSFRLDIPKADLLGAGRIQIDDTLSGFVATFDAEHVDGRRASDSVPDGGEGTPYSMVWAPGAAAPIPTWGGVEGPDFAAGPAASFDASDDLYVSYLVYNSERGPAKGAYLGHVTPNGIASTRVGDVSFPTDLHEDERTRTALAAEPSGHLHMLYHPSPGETHGSGDLVYVHATTTASGGIANADKGEDPSSAAGAREPFDGFAGQPDIVANGARTIACYATDGGDRISIVEREGAGKWSLVRNLDDARFCRLALDSQNKLHVAWYRETDDSREVFEGDLVYATEKNDWKEQTIASRLRDQTSFWETTGVNGGFDFDLDGSDVAAFMYEGEVPGVTTRDQYDGPKYARIENGEIRRENAPGLVPVHGNPQLVMWMDHDADGYMHVVTGYGSLDSYGMRAPGGAWYFDTDLDRTDALAFAVDSQGRATVVGTQPHGGTTLEAVQASFRAEPVLQGDPDDAGFAAIPGPMPLVVIAAIVGLLAALPPGLRYTVDHAPRVAGPAFAFVGGFSRLRKDKMLEHETRDRIVRAIEASPGASPIALQRGLDIPRSTFFYHLTRLEEEGLVHVLRRGRDLQCNPAGPRLRRPDGPVRDLVERDQRLLEMTRRSPGQSSGYYASELGLHPRTVHERLRDLERRELVSRDRFGPRDVRWSFRAARDEELDLDVAS